MRKVAANAPDRIPAPLPPNLNPRLVTSVQAMLPDGAAAARFDVPAPMIFPNLDGPEPGEKALFFSFNYAAGRWGVIGAGTATTNGTIETDPGVGIRAPRTLHTKSFKQSSGRTIILRNWLHLTVTSISPEDEKANWI